MAGVSVREPEAINLIEADMVKVGLCEERVVEAMSDIEQFVGPAAYRYMSAGAPLGEIEHGHLRRRACER